MTRPLSRGWRIAGGQRGMTLVMALVFLGMLALLGTNAAMNTTLQERMAGNTRNRDLAFEAAEAAVADAFATRAVWCATPFNGANGLIQAGGGTTYDPANPWNSLPNLRPNDAAFWSNTANWASFRTPQSTLQQVATQPIYVIEQMSGATGCAVGSAYRITARGVGGDQNAVAVLQALYQFQ